MPGKKTRRLWLNIVDIRAPKGTSRAQAAAVFQNSIIRHGYELPPGWAATVQWRNKYNAPWKSDPWGKALLESAQASEGFDLAMLGYLRRFVNKESRSGR